MQHHAMRSAPLMRGHHLPMHLNSAGGPATTASLPHMGLQMGVGGVGGLMGKPPPQPHNTISTPGPQASSTSLPHITNGAPLQNAPHHNRLGHQQQQTHPQRPHPLHSSNHMQKLRQQHQHLNNNNNNAIKHNQSQQPHKQFNNNSNLNASQAQPQPLLGGTTQQQHHPHQHRPGPSQMQQQQNPYRMPYIKHNNFGKPNMHHAVAPGNNMPKLPYQQQRHGGPAFNQPNAAYNKPKIKKPAPQNKSPNYPTPKRILQNPDRTVPHHLNTTPQTDEDDGADVSPISTSEDHVAADAQAIESAQSSNNSISKESDLSKQSSDDNTPSTSNAQDTTQINSILSNEDSSAKKSSKEKTPMCLVNELARFNKITHQYRLTNEKGPAHCKRFTVTLKLGDEEYTAEGFKIKKAQHLAAAEAIEKTKYKHPIPKPMPRGLENPNGKMNITPTVELNALAMKLGQQTYYLYDPRHMPPPEAMLPAHHRGPPDGARPPHFGVPIHGKYVPPGASPRMVDPAYMQRNGVPPGGYIPPHLMRNNLHGYNPKYLPRFPGMSPMPAARAPLAHGPLPPHYAAPSAPCKITLIVGKQKYTGTGRTLQQAKHDAAARALQVLKTEATNQVNEMLENSLDENEIKSPVSLIHEIALKRSMTVHFKVISEEGPAHMKNFVTACIVGSIVTEGEGNGKKISKKRAAIKMLEELQKLPPLTPTNSPVKPFRSKTPARGGGLTGATPNGKGGERRKRNPTSIKEKSDADLDNENPITKLIQLQQTRKEKEPVFELIAKNGNENSRHREFIIEVTAHGMVARGTGPNKKLAKRNAAEKLLLAMGIECVSGEKVAGQSTSQAAGDNNNSTSMLDANTQEKIEVPVVETSAGQVEGILIMRQNKKISKKKEHAAVASATAPTTLPSVQTETKTAEIPEADLNPTKLAATTPSVQPPKNNATEESKEVAKDLTEVVGNSSTSASETTNNGTMPSAGAVSSNSTRTNPPAGGSSVCSSIQPKDQLMYLGKLLGFEVTFNDYPKGNHNEFLTIVMLSTTPPQICHGCGPSSEVSQNDAAACALKILSELGFNSAKK